MRRLKHELNFNGKFLTAANIPDTVVADYPKPLVENRITKTTLPQHITEHFWAINITIFGNAMSILTNVKTVVPTPSPPPSQVDSATFIVTPFKPPKHHSLPDAPVVSKVRY